MLSCAAMKILIIEDYSSMVFGEKQSTGTEKLRLK